jgi:hypothetical protein
MINSTGHNLSLKAYSCSAVQETRRRFTGSERWLPWPKQDLHHYHHHPIAFLGLHDNRIFKGWGSQPPTQPPTWRTRPPSLWSPKTGWAIHTPRHWVLILVACYDMHELSWDYSYSPVTTQRQTRLYMSEMLWTIYIIETSFCSWISYRHLSIL